ncbi:hypothetical protein ARALYDRAFT_909836 [Arabidopsis lyrata subsp. lyrata]|uniref:RING-type domain-containing protein n=2 Tax=Arabidopsis lyrata subsp. lyrata TaxID=81972 RepID=D7LXT2_ARALL|nr:hypothetical protein ARALYDRAFT_909836 [Arabidopsis lyrata subsp. lyrata]
MIIIRKKINNGLIIGQSHYRTEVIAVVVSVLSLISKEKKRETKKKERELRSLLLSSILQNLRPLQITGIFGLQGVENKPELKTGALCCIVASRPLVTTKLSVRSARDIPQSSQADAMQWRTNFSFSPAGYTRDGLEQEMGDESPAFAFYSSSSRQRKSLEFRFQESPRWASNSSASGGNEQKTSIVDSISRPTNSNTQCINEENGFDRDSTAISTSFRSLLSLSESSAPWETPSNQSSSLTHCSYPRVFCNPVSVCENPEPNHTQEDSSTNPDSSFITSTRNHQVEEEVSPNSNSNDMLLDVERPNDTEVENPRSEPGSMTQQRCGICKKLLSQKSPWSSYKILRSRDMPAAGVFPCHHVYHVECLDKVTPTAQTRDPSCPVCSNTIGTMEQPLIAPETLQMALRSLRRSRTTLELETVSIPCNNNQRRHRSQKWEKLGCCLNISFSSSS